MIGLATPCGTRNNTEREISVLWSVCVSQSGQLSQLSDFKVVYEARSADGPSTPTASGGDPNRAFDRAMLTGRLVEIPTLANGAGVTAAVQILRESQQLGDPVAYITTRDDLPFAEDLIAHGLDLGALVIVRAPDGPRAGLAADRLLRSSGFGAVVIDLAASHSIPVAQLGRLIRLVAIHDAVALVLTEGTTHGSLIAMRVHVTRQPTSDGSWRIQYWADKDKRLGPGSMRSVAGMYGPPGLR